MFDDDGMGWEAQQDLEERQHAEEHDVETLLDNDPGYHEWADELDRLADEADHYNELAAMEDERSFRTLQVWD